MISWVWLTLFAAFMQSWRNAWQKSLSATVSPLGVTLARFVVAAPLSFCYLMALHHYYAAPSLHINAAFLAFVLCAALSQAAATALMVAVFRRRNYAVGVGLAKSEAIIAALLGAVFFQQSLTWYAWLGVIVGGYAVTLLSGIKFGVKLDRRTLVLGLACGICFALASLWVRAAANELKTLPYVLRAAWVLTAVLTLQTGGLVLWLSLRQPDTLRRLWRRKGLVTMVSLVGFSASAAWFTAMSIQSVALVKTLGQIEVWFTLMISARLFKEPLSVAEKIGLLLVVVSAILVIASPSA